VLKLRIQAGVRAPDVPEVLPEHVAVAIAPAHVERAQQIRRKRAVVADRLLEETDSHLVPVALGLVQRKPLAAVGFAGHEDTEQHYTRAVKGQTLVYSFRRDDEPRQRHRDCKV
jgi:hypothetical protein